MHSSTLRSFIKLSKIFLSGAGASSEIAGAGDGGEDVTEEAPLGTQPPPKRLAKNGVSERLFFDVRSRKKEKRGREAIWQDGESRKARRRGRSI